jgi:hypothetical protein
MNGAFIDLLEGGKWMQPNNSTDCVKSREKDTWWEENAKKRYITRFSSRKTSLIVQKVGRWPVAAGKIGLFTQTLNGADAEVRRKCRIEIGFRKREDDWGYISAQLISKPLGRT